MGAPVAVPSTSPVIDLAATGGGAVPPSVKGAPPASVADLLAGFGPVVAAVAQRDRDSAELTADKLEAGQKFLDDFANACEREVRPAMNAVDQELQKLGGGGLVEEHPGGEARFKKPRIILWMSLEGEVGVPRLDRYPYLLFEADVDARKVMVDEGDMWRGAGGNRSGRVGAWEVPELTGERIIGELLAIAQRAAG
jgi:hypothetical protein